MVVCAKCQGSSRVVLTRCVPINKRITKQRTRQCKSCRWKWKTIEVELPKEIKP